MPMPDADEAQRQLHAAALDLERLQVLLADACDTLLACFAGATAHLRMAPPAVDDARHQLGTAVTALQFQDMAQQLIAHTQKRLARCADRLEGEAIRLPATTRPNPVTQAGVEAGSIDLL
jgi:hypothetical protein